MAPVRWMSRAVRTETAAVASMIFCGFLAAEETLSARSFSMLSSVRSGEASLGERGAGSAARIAGAQSSASATAYRQVGMPSRTSKDSKCVKPRPLTVPPANSLDDKSDSCPRYCTRSSIFATIVVRSTGGFKLATRNP